MSMRTISGSCLGKIFRASSAVEATQTQRNSWSDCANSVRLSRMTLLSSTMAILVMWFGLYWHRKAHGRALFRVAVDLESAAQFFNARTHIGNAVHGFARRGRQEADAVVRDVQP